MAEPVDMTPEKLAELRNYYDNNDTSADLERATLNTDTKE